MIRRLLTRLLAAAAVTEGARIDREARRVERDALRHPDTSAWLKSLRERA